MTYTTFSLQTCYLYSVAAFSLMVVLTLFWRLFLNRVLCYHIFITIAQCYSLSCSYFYSPNQSVIVIIFFFYPSSESILMMKNKFEHHLQSLSRNQCMNLHCKQSNFYLTVQNLCTTSVIDHENYGHPFDQSEGKRKTIAAWLLAFLFALGSLLYYDHCYYYYHYHYHQHYHHFFFGVVLCSIAKCWANRRLRLTTFS